MKDGIELRSPMVTLIYKNGSLMCEDEAVLNDFTALIKEGYGARIDWNEAYDMIEWSTVPKTVRVVNLGNVVLDDDKNSGWNGFINAIWFDDNPPGKVIKIYHRIWVNKMMTDCMNLTLDELKRFNKEEVLRNMVFAKVYRIDDSGDKRKVDELIKGYLRWESQQEQ